MLLIIKNVWFNEKYINIVFVFLKEKSVKVFLKKNVIVRNFEIIF